MPCEKSESKEHYPTVYLDGLPKKMIEGEEAGKEVCIVLYGKLTGLNIRERENSDDNCCSIDIEVHKADVVDPDKKSEWADLVD